MYHLFVHFIFLLFISEAKWSNFLVAVDFFVVMVKRSFLQYSTRIIHRLNFWKMLVHIQPNMYHFTKPPKYFFVLVKLTKLYLPKGGFSYYPLVLGTEIPSPYNILIIKLSKKWRLFTSILWFWNVIIKWFRWRNIIKLINGRIDIWIRCI